MCRPASRSSHFSRSPSSVPSAASCAGTCHRRSSSVGLTNSWFASSEPEAGSLLAPHRRPQRYFSSLSRKIVPGGTIYMKNSVGVGGVQNRQSGCFRRMPSCTCCDSTTLPSQTTSERMSLRVAPCQLLGFLGVHHTRLAAVGWVKHDGCILAALCASPTVVVLEVVALREW
jgi:hypothetical protein